MIQHLSLSPAHQSLLKATFSPQEDALIAWEKWQSVIDFEDLDGESYKLLPHLYQNLIKYEVKHPLISRMKGVHKLFWCKNQLAYQSLDSVIVALKKAGIKTALMVAATQSNHSNIWHLQIQPDRSNQVNRIVAILQSLGWQHHALNAQASIDFAGSLWLSHEKSPSIILYGVFPGWKCSPMLMQDCWNRAEVTPIGTTELRVWNAADQVIFQVLQLLFKPDHLDHPNLSHWTNFILGGMRSDLDWEQLSTIASQYGLVVPLQQGLNLLKELNIPLSKSSSAIECLPTAAIERWEYYFSIQAQSHFLARVVQRYGQYYRLAKSSDQPASFGSFIKNWCQQKLSTKLAVRSKLEPEQIRPEWQLLLACGSHHPDPTQEQLITQSLEQSIDWSLILKLAAQEGMTSLLGDYLQTQYSQITPPSILKTIQIYLKSNRIRNIFLTQELSKQLDNFAAVGITAIPYKGITLAQLAYQDLKLRKFNDLDLLVESQNFEPAKSVLQANGYYQKVSYGWEETWHHPQKNVEIDLHQSLASEQLSSILTYEQLRSHLISLQFPDPALSEFKISTINPEMLFLLLATYTVKDHCAVNLRLVQLADAAALIKNNPNLDWNLVLTNAQTIGCVWLILVELKILEKLFNTPFPSQLKSVALMNSIINDLADQVIYKLLSPKDLNLEKDSFTFAVLNFDHLFYLAIRERSVDRLMYCLIWLKLILKQIITPNSIDFQWINIPDRFSFLYYPLHTIRVLYKYTIGIPMNLMFSLMFSRFRYP
jgi:Uncharacterised nucleotidyltransferase